MVLVELVGLVVLVGLEGTDANVVFRREEHKHDVGGIHAGLGESPSLHI